MGEGDLKPVDSREHALWLPFAYMPAGSLQRSGDKWLRPVRKQLEITRIDNLARSHVQEELWFRTATRFRISFFAVVVDQKLGQPRHEPDQVEPAAIVPVANLLFGDRVPSFLDSRSHPRDMKLNAAQPHVPDADVESRR